MHQYTYSKYGFGVFGKYAIIRIMNMKKLLEKIFCNKRQDKGDEQKQGKSDQNKRKELEIRVEKGADRAIREYGGALKKLAEYDRS